MSIINLNEANLVKTYSTDFVKHVCNEYRVYELNNQYYLVMEKIHAKGAQVLESFTIEVSHVLSGQEAFNIAKKYCF